MALRKPKRFWRPSLWASWRPFGVGLEHPNNFAELWRAFRENKGSRAYALRILRQGVCDGCALGTTGMRDWTQTGVHLCNIRLRLLRLNTLPPFDPGLLADLGPLRSLRGNELRDLGRIPTPLIRRHGEPGFVPISWPDALALVADRVRASTPDRLGFYLTARGLPNETYYAAQKAIRALGTNNLDNAARICHSPSTYALKDALGVAASTCSFKDWIGTDLVAFFGSNVANNQPVATKYLYLARKAGTRVALINTYREPGMERYWIPSVAESALFGTKLVTDNFLVSPGGDIAFIAGAMKHMFAAGLVDESFVAAHTEHSDALKAATLAASWSELERRSGATRASMEAFGALVGGARTAVFVWSMGMTQHTFGEDAVRQILNLGLLKGFVGHDGSGMMPIRGHSGVQGGAEMGAYATAFPGGLPIDAANAKALSDAWGFEVPATPGKTMPEVIDQAAAGGIDMLWSVGGNFLDVLPDPKGVEKALARIPLRVHQDLVLTRQMLLDGAGADDIVLILPAMTRYEIPGGVTSTSTERRIIFSPEIRGPRIPDARWEGEVLLELARRVHSDRPELPATAAQGDTAGLPATAAQGDTAGLPATAAQGDTAGLPATAAQGDTAGLPATAAQGDTAAALAERLSFADMTALRAEIAQVVPLYQGIEMLRKQGDQVQYGGPHLCAGWTFPTPSGKAHFAVVPLPEERVPVGAFLVTSRRGKQFNSMVHADLDRLTGARRDHIFMSPSDATHMGLRDDQGITLKSAHGTFSGRVMLAPVAIGSLQVHWPEGNALLDPRRRSRVSGIPDYNAVVTVQPR